MGATTSLSVSSINCSSAFLTSFVLFSISVALEDAPPSFKRAVVTTPQKPQQELEEIKEEIKEGTSGEEGRYCNSLAK